MYTLLKSHKTDILLVQRCNDNEDLAEKVKFLLSMGNVIYETEKMRYL